MIRLIGWLFLGLASIIEVLYDGLSNSNKAIRFSIKAFMIIIIIGSLSYATYIYMCRDGREFKKLSDTATIENYQKFIQDFPNSKKMIDAEEKIKRRYEKELLTLKDTNDYIQFIDKYSSPYYIEKYKRSYIEKATIGLNLEREKQEYLRKEKERKKAEEAKRRQQEEYAAWGTENNAWKTASNRETLASYRKYLALYPNGTHKSQAKKKIIDLEVADVFSSGDYGRLPSMDRTSYAASAYNTVTISNDTQYTLTLKYSGADSKEIVIAPRGTKSVRLKSGSYRIVASVNASGVRNFAGREELSGGSYNVSYYIQTSRW